SQCVRSACDRSRDGDLRSAVCPHRTNNGTPCFKFVRVFWGLEVKNNAIVSLAGKLPRSVGWGSGCIERRYSHKDVPCDHQPQVCAFLDYPMINLRLERLELRLLLWCQLRRCPFDGGERVVIFKFFGL